MTPAHHDGRRALAAIGIALLSALFFTLTYVLNRAAATQGGHWLWTAALRYLITLPLLLPLMPLQGGIAPVWRAMRAHPAAWLGCSTVGFVAFYLFLSFAASSGPSWLVAGSFQFTVVAGMLCAPLLYRDARRKVPLGALGVGALIVAGVVCMQLGYAKGPLDRTAWIALACVLASAVLYPIGNRLLLLHLERTGEHLNATQRVFGMTLASQPAWVLIAAVAFAQAGSPSSQQVWLAGGVALGAAEAMQAAELLFAIGMGALFLGEAWPQGVAVWGAALIVFGIVAFAWLVSRPASTQPVPEEPHA